MYCVSICYQYVEITYEWQIVAILQIYFESFFLWMEKKKLISKMQKICSNSSLPQSINSTNFGVTSWLAFFCSLFMEGFGFKFPWLFVRSLNFCYDLGLSFSPDTIDYQGSKCSHLEDSQMSLYKNAYS